MIKHIIGLIIAIILFAICMNLLTSKILTQVNNEKDKYESKIGQKFILEKDTLTIIDYSSIMETFTLSNGKQVNCSIIFNNDSVLVK